MLAKRAGLAFSCARSNVAAPGRPAARAQRAVRSHASGDAGRAAFDGWVRTTAAVAAAALLVVGPVDQAALAAQRTRQPPVSGGADRCSVSALDVFADTRATFSQEASGGWCGAKGVGLVGTDRRCDGELVVRPGGGQGPPPDPSLLLGGRTRLQVATWPRRSWTSGTGLGARQGRGLVPSAAGERRRSGSCRRGCSLAPCPLQGRVETTPRHPAAPPPTTPQGLRL
jgi:hypothetical protein